MKKRIIIGISGASGIIYGIRLLELLADTEFETHLIISKAAQLTRAYESHLSATELADLADVTYRIDDVAASLSSGSYRTLGMIIAPCSMKTLASIANGLSSNLLTRAAEVVLKERRKLVLLARETPLHLAHIENMKKVTEMGAIVAPPVPAFYNQPQSLDDIVNHTAGRVLDLFDIDVHAVRRWKNDT
ncbi:UbiX family flavin prenyltransferase [Legionella jordanis]|uniref:Flavin prenyltransferase UbiX n=1 Tax=Legionella jordanis TaxID=456 RepID=A0A0W0VE92_9GAMM|nr:UbiX family flavin prenyltransferase [Legionella jordanis]KTD18449.1 3-octaprenyl-4-hydroxybenzoate carboxy-lyase [Legionella jordanis]RMX05354.1 UbiX family flavin prenyltransferase [Legionella jordanis]RMX20797.1 UbiX family flavin prenyltransferase [Legionella jordanis]VEH13203.1 3-octaprenyl-4-hydroxybenzoate carboxy-lyase [Legionella jordanis]HAT8715022.1 UbiX family flavin prenyltransferase [Legionella jordanis]